MTREEAKVLLPIIQAFAEGKVIECRTKPSSLTNMANSPWAKLVIGMLTSKVQEDKVA